MSNTSNEILEGNKLIAEFMGYASRTDLHTDGILFMQEPIIPPATHTACYILDKSKDGFDEFLTLEFHSSWDWLMPVVESIIKLGWQFQLNSYGVSNDAKFINGENYVQNVAWSTPLLATYNVVVDFVKWHNKQKVLNQ